MVEKFMPDVYQKSIYYINYDKLWKKGVRCLLFCRKYSCPFS